MKTRPFFSVLAAIVLVLLLSGGAFAYWLASNTAYRLPQAEASTPAASMFVSRQSPLVVSLLVNPDRLTALGLAAAPAGQRKQIQSQWQQFRQKLLNQNGLNYQRDIQPWLGDEITFAVTTPDFDRDLSNGQQSGYLIAAAIKHPEKAKQAIQTYWQKRASRGTALVFEEFAGINFIYGTPSKAEANDLETTPALTTAVVGDRFVLFSNYPKVMRDAINNLQVPELSLGSSEAYQQALQRLSNPHVGAVFVHLPQLAAWLKEPTPSIGTAPTFDSLIMAIQLDGQGVVGDALVLAAADQTIESTRPSLTAPVQALQYLPAASSLAAAGKDLPQFWTQLNQGLAGYPALKTWLETSLQTQQQWQATPEEMFGWAQGEYALGTLSSVDSAHPDWVFVAERSDTAADAIAQLDARAQAQGTSVATFTIADHPVTAWTKLSAVSVNTARSANRQSMTIQAEVAGAHTTIGNYELFATSLDAIAEAIQAPANSLLNAEKFQQSIVPLPVPNGGYFYADASTLRSFVAQRLTDRAFASVLYPFLDALDSVALSSYGSSANAARSVIFLRP